MNTNQKGFTLIELLAVILILGIIALIAILTITTVIEDSKKGALKLTAIAISDAAETQCQVEQMKGENITNHYNISNGTLSSPLEIKNLPNSGTIELDSNCNASVAIANDSYCATKNGETITLTSNTSNCGIGNPQVPTTSESCFIFDEATHTIIGYNYSDKTCPSNISIPATINSIPVEHIADYAFVNADYDYIMAHGYETYNYD